MCPSLATSSSLSAKSSRAPAGRKASTASTSTPWTRCCRRQAKRRCPKGAQGRHSEPRAAQAKKLSREDFESKLLTVITEGPTLDELKAGLEATKLLEQGKQRRAAEKSAGGRKRSGRDGGDGGGEVEEDAYTEDDAPPAAPPRRRRGAPRDGGGASAAADPAWRPGQPGAAVGEAGGPPSFTEMPATLVGEAAASLGSLPPTFPLGGGGLWRGFSGFGADGAAAHGDPPATPSFPFDLLPQGSFGGGNLVRSTRCAGTRGARDRNSQIRIRTDLMISVRP